MTLALPACRRPDRRSVFVPRYLNRVSRTRLATYPPLLSKSISKLKGGLAVRVRVAGFLFTREHLFTFTR